MSDKRINIIKDAKNIVYQSKLYSEGNIHIGDVYINLESNERYEIPYALNEPLRIDEYKIIDRGKDLIMFKKLLLDANKSVLIHGPYGIGKTTFAKLFVHKYLLEFSYVAWISINKDIRLAFNDQVLLDNLHLEYKRESPSDNEKYLDDIFRLVLNRMRQLKPTEKKPYNLLIIDNLQEEDITRSIFNKPIWDILNLGSNWKVIATAEKKLPHFTTYNLSLSQVIPSDPILENEFILNRLIKAEYQLNFLKEQNKPRSRRQFHLEEYFIRLLSEKEDERFRLYALMCTSSSTYATDLLIRCYQLFSGDQYFLDRSRIVVNLKIIKSKKGIGFLEKMMLAEPNRYVKMEISDALKLLNKPNHSPN